MKNRHLLRSLSFLILSAALGLTTACSDSSQSQKSFATIDITGAYGAADFSLTDHNGQPRSLQDFAGKVVLLFFGYAQCPDVCPSTLAELAEVKKRLGPDGARLQVLFVTVDPERDTPAVLKAYMSHFEPSFLALYTRPEKLATLAQNFKLYYKKVPGPTPTSYTMDHSAGSYIFDPQGKLRLFASYGTDANALVADIKLLLQENP